MHWYWAMSQKIEKYNLYVTWFLLSYFMTTEVFFFENNGEQWALGKTSFIFLFSPFFGISIKHTNHCSNVVFFFLFVSLLTFKTNCQIIWQSEKYNRISLEALCLFNANCSKQATIYGTNKHNISFHINDVCMFQHQHWALFVCWNAQEH